MVEERDASKAKGEKKREKKKWKRGEYRRGWAGAGYEFFKDKRNAAPPKLKVHLFR